MNDRVINTAVQGENRIRVTGRAHSEVTAAATTILTQNGVTGDAQNRATLEMTRGRARINVPAVAAQGFGQGTPARTVDIEWRSNEQNQGQDRGTTPINPALQVNVGNPPTPAAATVAQRTTVAGPDGAYMRMQGVNGQGRPEGESQYYQARLVNGRYEAVGEPITPNRLPDGVQTRLDSAHTTMGAQGHRFTMPNSQGKVIVADAQPVQPVRRGPSPSGMA